MDTNVGTIDRVVRIVIGLGLQRWLGKYEQGG